MKGADLTSLPFALQGLCAPTVFYAFISFRSRRKRKLQTQHLFTRGHVFSQKSVL